MRLHPNANSRVCTGQAQRLVLVAASLILATASGAVPGPCPSSAAKVFVTAAGVIHLNGLVVSLPKLTSSLKALTPPPTAICYSRDNPMSEVPPAAMAALQAVVATRLPLSLYTDNTFTTQLRLE